MVGHRPPVYLSSDRLHLEVGAELHVGHHGFQAFGRCGDRSTCRSRRSRALRGCPGDQFLPYYWPVLHRGRGGGGRTRSLLQKVGHFVAGIPIPEAEVVGTACAFERFYSSLGVGVLGTVLDGICAFDVMAQMLHQPYSVPARNALRIELSDYLIERMGDLWMLDIIVACQELDEEDVRLYRSGGAAIILAAPTAPAPAVEDLAVPTSAVADLALVAPDEETFAAMRWASTLDDEASVLHLIRTLPKQIVEEQVCLYRGRDEATLAAAALKEGPKLKISLGPKALLQTRLLVAQRFHKYCEKNAINTEQRMPYGAMSTFIADNIAWKAKQKKLSAKTIREWHTAWRRSSGDVGVAAVGDRDARVPERRPQSLLRSRAPVPHSARRRASGGGRPAKAILVREELYEWFTGIRYAIDWKQLIAENRNRGVKHLARFPRSVLKLKVSQFLQDYSYACLLNGEPVKSFKADSWWFRRWEEEHGLSMRAANRKYSVPRHVIKERLEIFWVVLFRIRLLLFLSFGYDALILNFDQSPYHHNETGSQNRPTLAVRNSIVPVVEGNSDVKSRWTANLTTQSRFTASIGEPMPAAECMFKGERDGKICKRLQEFRRSRGFPQWFTVTVAPKGSYREMDIISWLRTHLDPWTEGRDWRIYLCDDYSAHKSRNVWNLCWSRGYVRLVHGGGATPIAQTPDTDLNEHVRRGYGDRECRLLLEKMRNGQVVPHLKHEECMALMLEELSNPWLHKRGAEGYKKTGQSIDLYGSEDELICREAGIFWNEETTD